MSGLVGSGTRCRIQFEVKILYINLGGKHEEERPLGIRKSKLEVSRSIGVGCEEV
jgi:hypothetical protein